MPNSSQGYAQYKGQQASGASASAATDALYNYQPSDDDTTPVIVSEGTPSSVSGIYQPPAGSENGYQTLADMVQKGVIDSQGTLSDGIHFPMGYRPSAWVKTSYDRIADMVQQGFMDPKTGQFLHMGTQSKATPPKTSTLKDLREGLLSLSLNGKVDQIRAMQQKLVDAGLLDPTASTYQPGRVQYGDATYGAYDLALREAVTRKASVDSVIAADIAAAKKNPSSTTTTDSKTVTSITDPTTAQGIITSTFQKLMGRDPNASEIANLTGQLNSSEQADSATQKTVSTTGSDGNTTSNVSTSGGSDPTQLVTNAAKATYGPEVQQHGESAFMGSLLGMLGVGGMH